jgi:hypothetical protein
MDIYDEDYFSIKPDNFLIGIEKDSTKVGMKDQWIDTIVFIYLDI